MTEHGDEIWNVPVDTIELGLGNVNVFVGYADGLALDAATNTIDKTALDAADAVGLYLSDGSLGMALMTADFPIAVLTEAPLLYGSDMKFTALRSDAGSVGLVGIPDITLTATNLEVDYNNGSSGSLWPGTPTADFVSTFGPSGLLVPDDTSGDTVGLDFSGGIIGASADNVLLEIGDFVYVSGSFAFSEGGEQYVDVASGLSGVLADAEFVGLSEYGTDPGGQTLGYSDTGATNGMIWNLPVSTINIGIGDASVFVGYSTGLTPTGANGTLTLADVENANGIGLLMSDVNLGLVLMKEDTALVFQEAPGSLLTLDAANLRFYALTASAATAGLVGIPYVTATASGIQIRVNEGEAGSAWLGNLADATPVVDFQSSFPDSNGYQVPLSTTGTSTVTIPYADEEIGASADQVLLQISQFVYLSGSFSFDKGPTLYVAVETGLTKDEATMGGLFSGIATAASAPADHSLAITADGSELWNVPVSSITIGIASGNIFAGYLNGDVPLDSNGNISESGLLSQGSVGLFMSNVAVGLAMLRAPPLSNVLTASSVAAAAVSVAEMSFFSLKADAGNVALVGIPDLTLSSTDLEVRVNQGSAAGAWVGDLYGADPVVNYQDSFPSTNGLQIPTDTTGAHPPVTLDYTDTDIGASADQVLLEISQFVYVSGGFSFDKGPGTTVDVDTGLNSLTGLALSTMDTYGDAATAAGRLGVTGDYSTIWNLPVDTIQIGLHDVYVFAGYTNTPIDTSTGEFTHSDLVNDGAIGLELQNVNLGMVLMDEDTSLIPLSGGTLLTDNLRFFALQATADSLGLVGVPEIQLNAVGATVSVNQGTFGGLWPALGSTGNPPVIDFVQTYGPGGYQVPTDTSGDSVALTFTAPLIAGGAQHFTIQISSFVYLTGSLYFAKGGQLSVPLTSGVVNDSTLTDLGLNSSIPGLSLTTANVNTLTIGASNVEAFVGVNGPYWNATNPDGIPDRDPVTGQIVSSEINSSAVGLVIDNLTFGLFLGTPTLPGDPIRYAALKATASDVAFVGINGLTATAQNIDIEVNMSSPTLEGLPVLPVINFSGLNGGAGYDVPTGALNLDGTPKTVTLDYSTPLIKASSTWIQLDLFGVLDVQGSIAFDLGPQETVTLSNGSTATLTTMTIGAAHVSAFVGYDGPYITDEAGDTNPNAVGLSLDNLSLGLFIGVDTATAQAYVAGSLDIPEIHLVGVPSAITLDGTATVDLDLGIGLLNGGTAINFAAELPVQREHEPARAGLRRRHGRPGQSGRPRLHRLRGQRRGGRNARPRGRLLARGSLLAPGGLVEPEDPRRRHDDDRARHREREPARRHHRARRLHPQQSGHRRRRRREPVARHTRPRADGDRTADRQLDGRQPDDRDSEPAARPHPGRREQLDRPRGRRRSRRSSRAASQLRRQHA